MEFFNLAFLSIIQFFVIVNLLLFIFNYLTLIDTFLLILCI
ncbi:hypothetical protein T03_12587 [Trichinella britovi]|uniref:Uncharacterized protein n=1 Tax=Trichinella britovi TaxID=45882 RepID=A0A0V0ZVS6_TRIBR|nr:hypothetical protein T03_12587 [Trichinella britovi]